MTEPELYYQNLPRKRVAAGALFLNHAGELLLVKPTYRNHWSTPGGAVDKEESPREACLREVKEEINLDVALGPLICVDYTSTKDHKGESLQFTFWGGVLDEEQISSIEIPKDEIAEFKFFPPEEAKELLGEPLKNRILKCLEAVDLNRVLYLENGEVVSN